MEPLSQLFILFAFLFVLALTLCERRGTFALCDKMLDMLAVRKRDNLSYLIIPLAG